MTGYEKLIKTMRVEAGRNQVKFPIKLAVMTSSTTCEYRGMELDSDDLLFAEHLTALKKGDKVLITKVSEDKFALIERVVQK
jgi:hypothetical protein